LTEVLVYVTYISLHCGRKVGVTVN